jgi:hypothetical protein
MTGRHTPLRILSERSCSPLVRTFGHFPYENTIKDFVRTFPLKPYALTFYRAGGGNAPPR